MTEDEILVMLKIDLEISVNQRDNYLKNLINLAKAAIKKEGIVFSEANYTVEEGMLIQMYAAYLYRKRKSENSAIPRSLRYALNNLLFSQKGSGT